METNIADKMLTLLVLLITGAYADVMTRSTCSSDLSLNFSCSADSVIQIRNITYAVSQNGTVSYEAGDCVSSRPRSYGCTGKQNCTINRRLHYKLYEALPRCEDTQNSPNCMMATYECVKNSDLLIESKRYSDSEHLNLSCPSNSILRIHNVTYAFSYDENEATDNCKRTVPLALGCNAKLNCSIKMREGVYHGLPLLRCQNQTSNYMNVNYECVPLTMIKDICGLHAAPDLTATEGYIASPFLANGSYPANVSCEYNIRGKHIRMMLLLKKLDTNDYVTIKDTRSRTYGGGPHGFLENYPIPSFWSDNITIRFSSDEHGHSRGFWIYYQKAPFPPTETPTTAERPTVPQTTRRRTTVTTAAGADPTAIASSFLPRARATVSAPTPDDVIIDGDGSVTPLVLSWTDPYIGDTAHTPLSIESPSSTLSFSTLAAILGAVFGFVGAAIAILFVIYLITRHRDHRRKRSNHRSTAGNDHVMWHNITNECLSQIIHKHEVGAEHTYNNNMAPKEDNMTQGYSKQLIEHSYC